MFSFTKYGNQGISIWQFNIAWKNISLIYSNGKNTIHECINSINVNISIIIFVDIYLCFTTRCPIPNKDNALNIYIFLVWFIRCLYFGTRPNIIYYNIR